MVRSRRGPILGDSQCHDIANAELVEIADRGVMRRIRTAPVLVMPYPQGTDRVSCPVIRFAGGEDHHDSSRVESGRGEAEAATWQPEAVAQRRRSG